MTPEELRLYTALQKKFREAMGEEEVLDRVMCDTFSRVVSYNECSDCDCRMCNGYSLRLPLPIDPVNPERGLWGMLQGWRKVETAAKFDGTDLSFCYRMDNGDLMTGKIIRYGSPTPTLALLKALAAQEGVTP